MPLVVFQATTTTRIYLDNILTTVELLMLPSCHLLARTLSSSFCVITITSNLFFFFLIVIYATNCVCSNSFFFLTSLFSSFLHIVEINSPMNEKSLFVTTDLRKKDKNKAFQNLHFLKNMHA